MGCCKQVVEPEAVDVGTDCVLDVSGKVGDVTVDVPGGLNVGTDVEYDSLEEEPVAGEVKDVPMVEGTDSVTVDVKVGCLCVDDEVDP